MLGHVRCNRPELTWCFISIATTIVTWIDASKCNILCFWFADAAAANLICCASSTLQWLKFCTTGILTALFPYFNSLQFSVILICNQFSIDQLEKKLIGNYVYVIFYAPTLMIFWLQLFQYGDLLLSPVLYWCEIIMFEFGLLFRHAKMLPCVFLG